MATKQVAGDGLQTNLAGMSKNQLYDIMCQMKTLVDQNKQQARQILIQNPALTRALFQAQIMLGMVQSPAAAPIIPSPASQNPQLPSTPVQQSNIQAPPSFSGQNQTRIQQPSQNMGPNFQAQPKPISPPRAIPQPKPISPPPYSQSQSMPSHLPSATQSFQLPHQLPHHTVSQPLSHQRPLVPSLSTSSQQPMNQFMPLQPPLPPQPRPPYVHQVHAPTGQNLGFQHHGGQQMQPSQHIFHSGSKHHAGQGALFQQGQLPPSNQSFPPSLYQGGNPHIGMEFNQGGTSKQTVSSQQQQQQIGPSNQPLPRPHMGPTPLSAEMEQALLQQVMSLTPEQIHMLPTDQRNQVLQLQQMILRQ